MHEYRVEQPIAANVSNVNELEAKITNDPVLFGCEVIWNHPTNVSS